MSENSNEDVCVCVYSSISENHSFLKIMSLEYMLLSILCHEIRNPQTKLCFLRNVGSYFREKQQKRASDPPGTGVTNGQEPPNSSLLPEE